jgi:galactonate dehydratase
MGVREAIDYIRVCLTGRDPLNIRPLFSEMLYGSVPPHHELAQYGDGCRTTSGYLPLALGSPTSTPTGPIVWGMSGVEMALCDLAGKVHRTPVSGLLGGRFRERVKVYLDRSSPPDSEDLDAWRRMATESVGGGFNQMKFDVEYTAPRATLDIWNRSIGGAQMRRIVERLTAVREAVGWDVEVCVDCHALYNTTDAIRLAQELAPLKLMWLEDPTPNTNPDACAAVREKSPIPICAGEMLIAEQYRVFIDRKACDIIHPDVLFCGGLHEARRIADYAELHYIPMAMHGNSGALGTIAAAHVAAATRNFLGLEYHFIEARWIGEFVRREGVALFQDGFVALTDAPGLGVELDLDVCRQHLDAGESLF